ncbi:MAG: endonuclease III [Candidatus Micrarchaeota archaeon]|nr:endonuclease III [Candidatus Micrarchaeota archaeon]MDE1804841.1 endonuclease III [Candidatus Micrarchaeota archaeon]
MRSDFSETVMKRLMKKYDDQRDTMLRFSGPTQLLVATMLSPQCTDKQVNSVTEGLFEKYRTFKDYANADIEELSADLGGINFYKTKARHVKESASMIIEQFNGRVPKTIGELMMLPGVGRKVANVVLTNGFGITEGIAIDTHCITVANRLRLARTRRPELIEKDLRRKIPKKYWLYVSNLFITLGRDTCKANKKECARCVLKDICPSSNAKPSG